MIRVAQILLAVVPCVVSLPAATVRAQKPSPPTTPGRPYRRSTSRFARADS